MAGRVGSPRGRAYSPELLEKEADGAVPVPGGWNRFALQVPNVDEACASSRDQGATFRADVITGVGVKQGLLQDPDGNLVELYEPLAAYHERL